MQSQTAKKKFISKIGDNTNILHKILSKLLFIVKVWDGLTVIRQHQARNNSG